MYRSKNQGHYAKELRNRNKRKNQLFYSGVLFMKRKKKCSKRSGGGLDLIKKNGLRVFLSLLVGEKSENVPAS